MTVRFDLSGLDREMPLALAMMPVLPKHGMDVEHFDNPTLKPPVGTGPYIIADVQPGKRMILRAQSGLLGAGSACPTWLVQFRRDRDRLLS